MPKKKIDAVDTPETARRRHVIETVMREMCVTTSRYPDTLITQRARTKLHAAVVRSHRLPHHSDRRLDELERALAKYTTLCDADARIARVEAAPDDREFMLSQIDTLTTEVSQ